MEYHFIEKIAKLDSEMDKSDFIIERNTRKCESFRIFTPFGRVVPELGKKLLHELIVLDIKVNVSILSIQPFGQDGWLEN